MQTEEVLDEGKECEQNDQTHNFHETQYQRKPHGAPNLKLEASNPEFRDTEKNK